MAIQIIKKNTLTILGAILGGLAGSWSGAAVGGLVGFILDNLFQK